ncbi:MAG: hypothetical protein K8F91_14005, partial [Candidatus Obscuribacterales bacterium]|nr:hypothetical protein [Candidatus Obscuribacterales bacterium]
EFSVVESFSQGRARVVVDAPLVWSDGESAEDTDENADESVDRDSEVDTDNQVDSKAGPDSR